MTLNEFKRLNKEKGFHWFDADTMRFFNSRISNWDATTGLFITSEQNHGCPRLYTIRLANFNTGKVETCGEFQQYKTLYDAKQDLKRYQWISPEERLKRCSHD